MYRTMEMNGGSSALYLARAPCVPLICTLFSRGGNRRACRVPGEGSFPLCCGTFAPYSVSKNEQKVTKMKKRDRTPAADLLLTQGRKRNPNPNFLVRIFSSGVGVFHVKGWGPKSSACPSKPGKSNFLGGISRDFAGISRRCPKSLRKKGLCSISVPYYL